MDSLVRMVRLGSYLAGVLSLVVAVIVKIAGVGLAASPRGIVFFAGACFFCSLASRELLAAEVPKEEPKAKAAAA